MADGTALSIVLRTLWLVASLLAIAPRPALAEWSIAAYLGGAHTLPADLSIRLPSSATDLRFRDVDYRGKSFDSPLYYGYRISYFLRSRPGIAIEGEFIHMKLFAETDQPIAVEGHVSGRPVSGSVPLNDIVQRFSLSHGLNFALVNVAFRRGLGRSGSPLPRAALEARTGVGLTVPHVESTIDQRSREGYEIGAAGVQMAGGVAVRVAGRVYGLVEYRLTATSQSVGVAGGTARGRFVSHHGTFGVVYRF